ncbi:small nuclear ribonucleoprotein 35kDa (U11 U12) [Tyrophagus putrescentiae]|nr:small nuclear ribonucleoprotein 35kDa (U11 U12) [Tyrophagus putrescentiae]
MSYRSGSEHHHHNHQHHHRNKAFSGGGSSSHHSFDRDDSGGDDDWNREDAINTRATTTTTNQVAEDPTGKPGTDRFYDSEPRKTLFIGRLAPVTTEADLRKFFSRFGEIRSLHLIRDILTGDSRRYAFLEYSRSKEADRAYAEGNNATLDGRRILVDREHGREEKTSIKTLRRPNNHYHRRGGFGGGSGGGGGPMRSSFSKDYSLSGFPSEQQRSRPGQLQFNGRGRDFPNSGASHYHPYNNGRSSNGNGNGSFSNGGRTIFILLVVLPSRQPPPPPPKQ